MLVALTNSLFLFWTINFAHIWHLNSYENIVFNGGSGQVVQKTDMGVGIVKLPKNVLYNF